MAEREELLLILVGGPESANAQELNAEVHHVLDREGFSDYVLAPTILQNPLLRLQAIGGYLSRQRNM